MRTRLPLLGDDVTKGALGPFAVRNVVQAKHGIHGQVTVGGGWMDGVAQDILGATYGRVNLNAIRNDS